MKVWRYAWAGSAAPKTVSAVRPASLDFSVGGMRASCRLTQHPLLGRSLSVSQQSGQARQLAYSAPLLGKPSACSYLAAIPQGLVSFPPCARSSLRCGPCSSPKPQSLPGSQEAGVPPAGADSVGIPLLSTRHRLRRSDSARLRLERSASIRAVSRSGSGR